MTQVGLVIMMNCTMSMISDVIGKEADSSAFVYGIYSFVDKIANGIAIERAVQLLENDPRGLRYVICFIPILCCALAFALAYLGNHLYSDLITTPSMKGPQELPAAEDGPAVEVIPNEQQTDNRT